MVTESAVHFEGLKALRADLVEQRREAVGKRDRLAAKAVASSVENWQRLIEAVDRALADEGSQAPQIVTEIGAARPTTPKKPA